jgi:hypothetical protein
MDVLEGGCEQPITRIRVVKKIANSLLRGNMMRYSHVSFSLSERGISRIFSILCQFHLTPRSQTNLQSSIFFSLDSYLPLLLDLMPRLISFPIGP